ncbi:hypothetical protein EWM62_16965 [Mucilaginibacter terrigena]|uniref:DUF3828 domain-containing protein n=1 Tax=Mucilaginibacter terrigena TaxID=2492395 RepID=A0A4V1ZBF2_9SPHI|nr:hypothetical protein [Mucilaginibacter terrigena]RYU86842.1 hypothetical protein EWM62_16965 [Mucilaginibacter terrigena]
MKAILYNTYLLLGGIMWCFISTCMGQPSTKQHVENRRDSLLSPAEISTSYLYWYISHKSKLDRINIFQADTASDTDNYKVDFKRVNFYLNQIKKSGFVSEKYIDTLKKAYLAADEKLNLHPQNDGPIQGFEYDPILGIQEETEITQNVNEFKVISNSIKDDHAVVLGKISDTLWIRFDLSKTDKKWLINAMHPYFK